LFIFLDTETTGTGGDDRLCQLAYKSDDDKITHNKLYNPGREISVDAMCVHHITNEMVAKEPPLKDSEDANNLNALFSKPDTYLVAHSAAFDVEMLNREGIYPKSIICTLKLARYLDTVGFFKKHNLQYLRYSIPLKVEGAIAHDAYGDILVLEALFTNRLYPTMLLQNENDEQKAIQKMLEISSKPSLLPRILFGKHKDTHFSKIPKDYLQWLSGQKDLDEDLEYTIKYYLNS
jgi:exodeoxyribonuclease X